MCTMTWFETDKGYELFFNRDERLSRGRALPPTLQSADNVAYLSPTDSDAGGTWISVNHYGVTVCLLNHYQFEQIETYKDWVSRGEMVKQFATTSGPLAAISQFNTLVLDDYRAFRMLVLDPHGQCCLFVWDGHQPRIEHKVMAPKSSSSMDAVHVKSKRRELFVEMGLPISKNRDDYLSFHTSHRPNESKESVCMHRQDAKTVSLCHVKVNEKKVSFSYADGSPCEVELGLPMVLDLVDMPLSRELSSATSAV